jgi:CHAD domain-containing protein
VAHPPKYPDYAGQLLDYLSPLPPKSSSTAVLTTVGEQATLDRILAKIGKKFIPDDLNRMALWIAVKQAADDKKNVDRYRSRARTHAIVKSMKRVRNAAESLAAVIKENEDTRELLVEQLASIQQLIGSVSNIVQLLTRSNVAIRARYDRIPSANDWLAGIELPLIFEDFFHRKPGRSRVNDKPGGPGQRRPLHSASRT